MKRNTKTYKGMTYRQLQAENSGDLNSKEANKLRKQHGLTNRGWGNVIDLYEWLHSALGGMKEMGSRFAKIIGIAQRMKEAEYEIRNTIDAAEKRLNAVFVDYESSNVIPFPTQKEA